MLLPKKGPLCSSLYLFDQRPLLLLVLFVSGLQVPVELGLHGLHVDLQTQLGVLRGLQLVLQLLQLSPHLLQLLIQSPLGLLQLMDLDGGREDTLR